MNRLGTGGVVGWCLCLTVVSWSVSPSVYAQPTHATPTPAPAAPVSGPAANAAGWSGRQFAREVPVFQGPLSGLAKWTVVLPDKRTITVGELGKSMFKDQQRFEAEVRQAPAGALLGAVKVEEVGQEYAHAYVLTRTVSVVYDLKRVLRIHPIHV